jgi:uncharacterized membrane protein
MQDNGAPHDHQEPGELHEDVEKLSPRHRLDVAMCYWLTFLFPLVIYLLRRGKDGERAVRFHALQAIFLFPLVFIPFVNLLMILTALVCGLLAAVRLRGIRIPVLASLADRWA